MNIVRQRFGSRDAAQEFVHEAKLALQEPHERNLATVEVSQVDTAAEYTAATVFWMIDRTAAEHCNVARWVKDRYVDADFHRIDRGLVLSIKVARVGHDEMDGAAVPLQSHGTEIEHTVSHQGRERILCPRMREQHGVTKMMSCLLMAEDVRD